MIKNSASGFIIAKNRNKADIYAEPRQIFRDITGNTAMAAITADRIGGLADERGMGMIFTIKDRAANTDDALVLWQIIATPEHKTLLGQLHNMSSNRRTRQFQRIGNLLLADKRISDNHLQNSTFLRGEILQILRTGFC